MSRTYRVSSLRTGFPLSAMLPGPITIKRYSATGELIEVQQRKAPRKMPRVPSRFWAALHATDKE